MHSHPIFRDALVPSDLSPLHHGRSITFTIQKQKRRESRARIHLLSWHLPLINDLKINDIGDRQQMTPPCSACLPSEREKKIYLRTGLTYTIHQETRRNWGVGTPDSLITVSSNTVNTPFIFHFPVTRVLCSGIFWGRGGDIVPKRKAGWW